MSHYCLYIEILDIENEYNTKNVSPQPEKKIPSTKIKKHRHLKTEQKNSFNILE